VLAALVNNMGYTLLLLASVAGTVALWTRLARRDPRLLPVYIGGLVAAFAGAKVVYLLAEGWMFWDHPHRWEIWAAGKTILGALLGGYVGVEFAKSLVGYRRVTGDLFAIVVPIGIIGGRLGCLVQGCCPGVPVGTDCAIAWTGADGMRRWPAVPLEIGFNLAALGCVLALRRWRLLPGQHFHLYLIAYGVFRFGHECMRATPRIGNSPFSGYHLAALAVIALGTWGFAKRQRIGRNEQP
jgi:phosphatidylglycerol:prolipoprotein diacylglycerol transferase